MSSDVVIKKKTKTIENTKFFYRILVIQNTPRDLFDYTFSQELAIGQLVLVPFGKKESFGMIYAIPNDPYESLTKDIFKIFPLILNEKIISFINKFSSYHLSNKNTVLKKILQKVSKRSIIKKEDNKSVWTGNLTEEQEVIYNHIRENLSIFSVSLIFGVTGSGKTEIYIKLIHDILNEGGQVLFLLPEIGIVSGMEERIKKTLGINPLMWFAGGKTTHCWQRVYDGDSVLVIGARSAIFLPFKNLKLIIVDEEQDLSYKEENNPAYYGKNMSILLGQIWKCNVILGSATPSSESYYQAQLGRYKLYYLKNRYGTALLPKVCIIPDTPSIISKFCLEKMKKTLDNNQQVLVYLNKRGFSTILECNNCGTKQICENCTRILVLHNFAKTMICHLCNKRYPINICVTCKEIGIQPKGYGIERLAAFIGKSFPEYKIGIFSSDFCNSKGKIQDFINKVINKEFHIIIGTQIIAKGHNFPGLDLVVIINTFLQSGDFRSKEILIQNVLQVSGRAGRYNKNSEVLIQSNDNTLTKWFMEINYENFLQFSLKERKEWDLPPFSKLGIIPGENSNMTILKSKMHTLFHNLLEIVKEKKLEITIFPPAVNQIEKINNKYRMFILMKTHNGNFIPLKSIIEKSGFYFEINPYDFL